MTDPDAALARWVSRAPLWLRTLSFRRDLALPLVVLAVQLTGAAVSDGHAHAFNPVSYTHLTLPTTPYV